MRQVEQIRDPSGPRERVAFHRLGHAPEGRSHPSCRRNEARAPRRHDHIKRDSSEKIILREHNGVRAYPDWAAERTNYAREVCETALAHVVGDQTEAAYRRGDLFETRRHLMNDWAKFCATPAPEAAVLPLKKCLKLSGGGLAMRITSQP